MVSVDRVSSEDKAQYIQDLFDQIAEHYDILNHVISAGQWPKWHREFAMHTCFKPGDQILDVACGTGDISLLSAAEVTPGGKVIGIDFSERMLEVGRRRVAGSAYKETITLRSGDAMDIPFPANSFDGVTMGWAMRNVASIPRTLSEINRVLKPGSRFVCLDAAKPYSAFLRLWFFLYWKTFLPAVDRFYLYRARAMEIRPYTYLSQSLDHYPMPHELEWAFREAGFQDTKYRLLMLGAVAIHVGIK